MDVKLINECLHRVTFACRRVFFFFFAFLLFSGCHFADSIRNS